jgi:hypothetical protein
MWLRRRFRPDHLTLRGGPWQYHLPPDAGPSDVRVLVVCAPSRSLRRPSIDVDRAIAFVHTHFPGSFGADPTYSNVRDGVRFTNSTATGIDNGRALVASTGRLDFVLPVAVSSDEVGHRRVDVLALLEPISAVARAVQDATYPQVLRVRRTLRSRRFDWCIGVSVTSHGSTGAQEAWHELVLPGRPARRATEQRPFCPTEGYAAAGLTSRRASRPVDDLLRLFLVSFFECNGYHDFHDAIIDVLDALRQAQPGAGAA